MAQRCPERKETSHPYRGRNIISTVPDGLPSGIKKHDSMNEKQQQLTFDKGIANVPSDAICSDNALGESLGMTYENGEHKPIQKPVLFATITDIDSHILPGVVDTDANLLYVHRLANQERYIVCVDGKIAYGVKEQRTVGTVTQDVIAIKGWLWNVLDGDKVADATNNNALVYTSSTNVTSVGKTLIINNDDGINYYLWKNEYTVTNSPNRWEHRMYSFLGNRIPEPKVEFRMVGSTSYNDFTTSDTYCAKEKCPIVGLDTIDDHYWTFEPDGHEDWKNAVVGLYNNDDVLTSIDVHICYAEIMIALARSVRKPRSTLPKKYLDMAHERIDYLESHFEESDFDHKRMMGLFKVKLEYFRAAKRMH